MEAITEDGVIDAEFGEDGQVVQGSRLNRPEDERIQVDIGLPKVKPADGKLTKVKTEQVEESELNPPPNVIESHVEAEAIQSKTTKVNYEYQKKLVESANLQAELALRPRRNIEENVFERLYAVHEEAMIRNAIRDGEMSLSGSNKSKSHQNQEDEIPQFTVVPKGEKWRPKNWSENGPSPPPEPILRLYEDAIVRYSRKEEAQQNFLSETKQRRSQPLIDPVSEQMLQNRPETDTVLAFKRGIAAKSPIAERIKYLESLPPTEDPECTFQPKVNNSPTYLHSLVKSPPPQQTKANEEQESNVKIKHKNLNKKNQAKDRNYQRNDELNEEYDDFDEKRRELERLQEENEEEDDIKVIDREDVYMRYVNQKKKEFEQEQEDDIKVIDREDVYMRYVNQQKKEQEEYEQEQEESNQQIKSRSLKQQQKIEKEKKWAESDKKYQKYEELKKKEERKNLIKQHKLPGKTSGSPNQDKFQSHSEKRVNYYSQVKDGQFLSQTADDRKKNRERMKQTRPQSAPRYLLLFKDSQYIQQKKEEDRLRAIQEENQRIKDEKQKQFKTGSINAKLFPSNVSFDQRNELWAQQHKQRQQELALQIAKEETSGLFFKPEIHEHHPNLDKSKDWEKQTRGLDTFLKRQEL
ncbi:MAG: hypothetical protein EZS28_015055, partial [Streblomastix strix]